MKNSKILIFFFIFIFCNFTKIFAIDIRTIYSKEYHNALVLKDQFENQLKERGITDTNFYMALVFPEMIRFNIIKNELETIINKIAYTTIDDYSGCSIGPFQIKPSCALDIERYVKQNETLNCKYPLLANIPDNDSFTEKFKRINRLQQNKFQIEYLLAFVDICTIKYDLEDLSVKEQLKVSSAAYNIGFLDNRDLYYDYLKIKSFPYGSNSSNSYWNYTTLVLDFYNQFSDQSLPPHKKENTLVVP